MSLVDGEKNVSVASIGVGLNFREAKILGISQRCGCMLLPLARSAHIRHTLLLLRLSRVLLRNRWDLRLTTSQSVFSVLYLAARGSNTVFDSSYPYQLFYNQLLAKPATKTCRRGDTPKTAQGAISDRIRAPIPRNSRIVPFPSSRPADGSVSPASPVCLWPLKDASRAAAERNGTFGSRITLRCLCTMFRPVSWPLKLLISRRRSVAEFHRVLWHKATFEATFIGAWHSRVLGFTA